MRSEPCGDACPEPFSPLGWSLGGTKGCIPGVAEGFVGFAVLVALLALMIGSIVCPILTGPRASGHNPPLPLTPTPLR